MAFKMNKVFKIVFACCCLPLLSLNVLAMQRSTLFLGKLDLRAKPPITELSQVSTDLAIADEPYFFDRTHLYFTQAFEAQNDRQATVFVWDTSAKKIRSIIRSNESGEAASDLPMQSGLLVIRQKDRDSPELRALDKNAKPESYLLYRSQAGATQTWINAYQFEKSPWFLYVEHQQQNQLKAYNTRSKKTIVVAQLPKGSEYFSVSSTGHVIASDGNQLYQRQVIAKGEHLQAAAEWKAMAIDSPFCKSGVSKTAISRYGDMIAILCDSE
tara:strand:- start:9 stop:818 length:810 start_codon:yes stop_codon:yes gene_type:complete